MPRFASVALVVWALALPVAAQDLVLTNANIVDPSTRTVVRGALWIEGGRIVGRGADAPASAPGARIDVGGRWVIPGLVDLHTHSFGNFAPPAVVDAVGTERMATRVLRAGVTAFLDLFSDETAIFTLRDRQRAGAIGGAEIFAAGPCITATKGHCSEYGVPTRIIDSPADARRHVDELAAKRPDVVKVVYDHPPGRLPSIDRPTLDALVAAARERGLKTIVHVGTWEDARHSVLAGASAITHVPRDGIVPDDLAALMAQRKTLHIPTMTVHADMQALTTTPALLDTPLMMALAPETIRNAYRTLVPTPAQREGARDSAERSVASVRRLHAAGVPMLAGTDAGNPGVIHGFSVHRELIRVVEAGMRPWDALAAATTKAGEFLGRRYGVSAGDDANVVVVDKSPLDQIANTQQISLVVMRGQIAYRK
jgi:imidazolonepropionase-like amidohydrolase